MRTLIACCVLAVTMGLSGCNSDTSDAQEGGGEGGAAAGAGGAAAGAGGVAAGAGGVAGGTQSDAGLPDATGGNDAGIETSDCYCVPENSVPEAAWLTLSEGSSGCQAGSDVYYGVPNPSKCPQLTCTSSGIGYYVGTCDENDEPSASYNSFDTDYATCHPVAAPAGGGLYFDATKVYWGCAPSGYVAPFDKTYCVETHVAQAGSCPAKHFCVPKSAGTPCVMTYGDTPLDGWTGNAIYGKVQCAPADGDLLAPGSATVYEESGCSGAAVDFVDKSCMRTSSGGAPKSYRMIDPGSTKKVPGNIPDSSRRPLSCRP